MSTDKFGRHRNRVQTSAAFQRIQSQQQQPTAITLTSEGDVNVNGKRIRFVGDAQHDDDAINKKCMHEYGQVLTRLTTAEIDQIKKEIITKHDSDLREITTKHDSDINAIVLALTNYKIKGAHDGWQGERGRSE